MLNDQLFVALNGVLTMMLAKFMLNDMPHTLELIQSRATSRWQEILKYCHTINDIRTIASGHGDVYVYHGAPTAFAEAMIKSGPQVPYKVEDTARYVASIYSISYKAFAPWAYRRHEVREKLSTATAPVAARWAWSFPLGEVLTDLNSHARMYIAMKALSQQKRISMSDAYEQLGEEAIKISRETGQKYTTDSTPDLLGLPDKLAFKEKTGALVQIRVDASALPEFVQHDAGVTLKYLDEEGVKGSLMHWNHNYMDMRINPEDIKSIRIVVRGMEEWEQDEIERMVKEGQISGVCGL